MNEAQKQRAVDLIDVTKTYRLDAEECAMQMAALLQEMVDAPEPEPVARVTGYYAGYLSIATVDGRVLPAGTALYLAPPAPSVPDGWKLVPVEPTPEPFGYFKAEPFGWTDCAETDDGAIALFDAPPAPIYNAPAYMATHDAWRGLEPFLGKDVPDSEVVLLSDVKAMLTTPPATDQSEQHLGMVPADVEAINSIDARFCGRLALILECVILDPHGHFDLACQLLEEYKAEWEKVNPSPPTFMGEPIGAVFRKRRSR